MQAARENWLAAVLCVGDDEVELQLRRLILERSGYRVSTSRSSREALELLRCRHLDLIISGYALEGGTSLAMLRAMQHQRPDLAALLVLSNIDAPKDVPSGVRLVRVVDGPAALLAGTEEALNSRTPARLRTRLELVPRSALPLAPKAGYASGEAPAHRSRITPVPKRDASQIPKFPIPIPVGAALGSLALSACLMLALWLGGHSTAHTPSTVSNTAVEPVRQPASKAAVTSGAGLASTSGTAKSALPTQRELPTKTVTSEPLTGATTGVPVLPTEPPHIVSPAEAAPAMVAAIPVEVPFIPEMIAAVRPGTPVLQPSDPHFVPERSLNAHSDWVTSVKFDADGEQLVSASWDQSVKLWNVSTGEQVKTIAQHIKGVQAMAFSRDGSLLAEEDASDAVKVWNTSAMSAPRELRGHGTAPQLLQGRSWVYSIAFSPDGRWLATGVGGKAVRIWDLETGQPVRDLAAGNGSVLYVAFSPNGRWLVSGGGKTVRIWDVKSGEMVRSFSGHTDLVYAAVFSPDGRTLASASKDRSIKLWDVESGRLLYTLRGHHGFVTSIAFSPDGKGLLSGSWDTTLKLWDVSSGRELQTLKGNTHPVYSVAFASNGKWIASGSEDGSIHLWRSAEPN